MKTAVQLIKEEIQSMLSLKIRLSDFDRKQIIDLIELSIEREKQQIIDTYVQSKLSTNFWANEATTLKYCNEAEEYYKQIFTN